MGKIKELCKINKKHFLPYREKDFSKTFNKSFLEIECEIKWILKIKINQISQYNASLWKK